MKKAKRRQLIAERLRNDLLIRWKREQQEKKHKEAQQADLMRWVLGAGTPKLSHRRTKSV